MNDWQTIDSAPRGDQYIVVFSDEWHDKVPMVATWDESWILDGMDGAWCDRDGGAFITPQPTHWAPLPPLPQ